MSTATRSHMRWLTHHESAPPRLSSPRNQENQLSPRNQEKARALGLTSATGLVIGSIIGTGVFTMPAVLAGAGHQLAARAGA